MNHYHVLYTSDCSYFPHMMSSICSLCENNLDSNITVHIIEDHFTEENLQRLYHLLSFYENLDLKVYPIEKISKSIVGCDIPKWRGTDIANARLFSDEVLEGVDKVLYLDCDTIVIGSLKELFQKDISSPLSAVKELLIPSHITNMLKSYYNSGVLLFDYTLWDDLHCSRKIYDYSKKYRDFLKYPDQDLINLALRGMISTLEPNYNVHPTVYMVDKHHYLAKKFYQKYPNYYALEEVDDALENSTILHALEFMNTRVWDDNCIHPFNSFYEKYRKIWDVHFKKEVNENKSSKRKGIAYLKVIADSFIEESTLEKMKTNVKRITHKK